VEQANPTPPGPDNKPPGKATPPPPAPPGQTPDRDEPSTRGSKRGSSKERFEIGDWQEG